MYGSGNICVSKNLDSHSPDDRWVAVVTDTTDMAGQVVRASGVSLGMALMNLISEIQIRLGWWPDLDKIDVVRSEGMTCH